MAGTVPKIEPISLKEYDVKQSRYSMVPQIPFRSIVLGPSGSGKTILLQNMILDIYRNCFSRIYIFRLVLRLIRRGYQ
jgi:DNA replication protein DnaC